VVAVERLLVLVVLVAEAHNKVVVQQRLVDRRHQQGKETMVEVMLDSLATHTQAVVEVVLAQQVETQLRILKQELAESAFHLL
jgi:hypothetical protein